MAAPLNNIADLTQEPAIKVRTPTGAGGRGGRSSAESRVGRAAMKPWKNAGEGDRDSDTAALIPWYLGGADTSHRPRASQAWRAPKNVRVPSPMRADSEGLPFSTPSPMHPRLQEVAAGGARISLATSSQGEGEQTPGGGELPLSPLGQNAAAGGRREFGAAPGGRHQRSPSKRGASLRASAPAFSGYASVALAQRDLAAERPEAPLGSSTASTVHPRVVVGESQQGAGPPTRESSLGMEPALRASNGSLRLSREASAAGASAGPAPRHPSGLAGEGGAGAFDQPQLAAAQEAAQETPAPLKRDVNDLIEFSTGRGQAGRREASTPSTGDSHGTYKVGGWWGVLACNLALLMLFILEPAV